MVNTAIRNSQGERTEGEELVRGIHFVHSKINGRDVSRSMITVRHPNGAIRNMEWRCDRYFEPYLLKPAMEDIIGRPEGYEKSHVDHLEERKKAWELTREYVLKWWEETGKDVDNPAPMTVYDVQLEAVLPFYAGALSALTGKVIAL